MAINSEELKKILLTCIRLVLTVEDIPARIALHQAAPNPLQGRVHPKKKKKKKRVTYSRRWIKEGAPYRRSKGPPTVEEGSSHY
jgi:hypothetical protein